MSEQSATNGKTLLGGRRRFYKEVGVVAVPPPWEAEDAIAAEQKVDSPISAGVDGSQSASGVHHLPKERSLEHMLSPRRPGCVEIPNSIAWFGVTLDGRVLKSPMGQTLAVPSQQLAFAIAAEWDSQLKFLKPSQMPLMTLACTALDQASIHPDVYREQSLSYLPTDTVSFKTLKRGFRAAVFWEFESDIHRSQCESIRNMPCLTNLI